MSDNTAEFDARAYRLGYRSLRDCDIHNVKRVVCRRCLQGVAPKEGTAITRASNHTYFAYLCDPCTDVLIDLERKP